MLKNMLTLFFVMLIAVSVVSAEGEEKYGKEITLKEKTKVTDILSAPETFNGKTVLVEGEVLAVCQGMGCWIEIAGEKENEKIKIKVEDGVIVFPKDAKGKKALVEGVVAPVKAEACEGDHSEGQKHEDGESCCSKDTKAYQIEGLGAVIK